MLFTLSKTNLAFPDPDNAPAIKRSLSRRLISRLDSWRIERRLKRRQIQTAIVPLGSGMRPLRESDIPLIFLTRNSANFLPSFLSHYRKIGVTRFLCIDDRSSDETRNILLQQCDVDLFESPVRYGEADRGKFWRHELVKLYGIQRWYLNVDCDEYLIYDQYEDKPLSWLIAQLEAKGIKHCPAPMIDLYPSGPLSSAVFDGSSDIMPWKVANMFDASGYRMNVDSRFMSLIGGPRGRILNEHVELMKYPLLYVATTMAFASSIHKPLPFYRNFSPICGSLLHFKFFSDALLFAEAAVADAQYYRGAHVYKNVVDVLGAKENMSLTGPDSLPFKDSRQFAKLGLFKRL